MPTALTFAVGETTDFNQPLREVAVSVGTVVVSRGARVNVVEAGDTFDCEDQAGYHLHAPYGATASVTYSDEPPAPTPPERKSAGKSKPRRRAAKRTERGDTGGGDSGGFESRTRDQLRKEAKKRKVEGYSSMTKPQLIKALRG